MCTFRARSNQINSLERTQLQHKIVALHEQGLTHRQIADSLGVSKSGVGYRLSNYKGDTKYPTVTSTQEQLLLGSLLGDASLGMSRLPQDHNVGFCHGIAQLHYLQFKHKLLNSTKKIRERTDNGGFVGGKPRYQFEYHNKPYLRDVLYPLCAPNGIKKEVNRAWLDRLTLMGVAFWYQDDGHAIMGGSRRKDGSHKQPVVRIATNGFDDYELDIILDYFLERWGWKFSKLPTNKGRGIVTRNVSAKHFVDAVSPYLTLKYKVFPTTNPLVIGSYWLAAASECDG